MAYPKYFDVDYEINFWMSIKNKPDVRLAQIQWRKLYQTMITLGADVEVLNGHIGLPDLVFTANAGVVHNNVFIPANFLHAERKNESEIFRKWFAENGFQIVDLPRDIDHEGHGDLLKLADRYYQGYGFRSSNESHEILTYLLNAEIVCLELVNGYFYHLDTCFCPIHHNGIPYLIYYDGAFSSDSLNKLNELNFNKFNVPENEAKLFACNSIQVNNNIILQEGCLKTAEWISSIGMNPIFRDMSQFHLSGGSAKCTVLQIS